MPTITSGALIVAGYYAIASACDILDCSVLVDLVESDGVDRQCFSLGQPQELAAGLRRFEITPYFLSLAELEQWCETHRKQIDELAGSDTLYALGVDGQRI